MLPIAVSEHRRLGQGPSIPLCAYNDAEYGQVLLEKANSICALQQRRHTTHLQATRKIEPSDVSPPLVDE